MAAGYALFGSATMVVLTTGNGVNGFTLDPVSNRKYMNEQFVIYDHKCCFESHRRSVLFQNLQNITRDNKSQIVQAADEICHV